MRMIDVDKISNMDISLALGVGSASSLPDIRQLLDEQPTVKTQCVATVKVDFSKEDIEKMIEQKVKESIEFNLDSLKELLMEYFRIGVDCYTYNLTGDKSSYKCGTVKVNDFEEFNEDAVNDIVDFIKERISTCNFS